MAEASRPVDDGVGKKWKEAGRLVGARGADFRAPGYEREQSALYEANLLGPEERGRHYERVARAISAAHGVLISCIVKAPGASLRARLPGASTTPGLTFQRACLCNGRRSAGAGRKVIRELEEASSAETTASESAA